MPGQCIQTELILQSIQCRKTTLQIYFDFSGYSLMAIRHGKLMGFAEVILREYRFPELSPKERYRWCTHVYSLCGIIRIWAEGGFRESPEELVSYLQV